MNDIPAVIKMFENLPYLKTFLISLVFFFFYLLARQLTLKSIDKKKMLKQDKVLLKRKIDQYLIYFFVLCIFLLWFSQLQVVFVSMLAFTAAIVIAFKELIMCITGGSLVKISNVFQVGHRVDIDGARGFVVEKNLLTTKLLEIGPEKNSQQTTGDIITIPNSLMLSKNVKNESYFKGYSLKSFVYKVPNELLVDDLEKILLSTAVEFSLSYLEDAKKGISKFCEKEGLLVPSFNPKTKVIVEDGKDFSILIKLPVPITAVAELEQKLNRTFLDWRIKNKEFKDAV
jgi:small-conductance mechanosensitive channel